MRKTKFLSIIAVAMLICFGNATKAQFSNNTGIVGANVGASLIGLIFKAVDYADDPYWKASSFPSTQLSFDYKLHERFSIGGAASFSNISVDYNNPTIDNVLDGDLQNFKFGFQRINVASRSLLYYVSRDMFDLYSGLRLGVNIWRLSVESTDPDFIEGIEKPLPEEISGRGVFLGVQLIALGTNIYVAEDLGINFEFAIGQPYFAAIGVRYRFPI